MRILITGGSSGIGEYLALEYAKQGHELFLTGRNKERLDKVAAKCNIIGGKTKTFICDVCNQEEMKKIISGLRKLDIVVANAGISTGTLSAKDALEEESRKVLDTNILGVANTVYPAISLMKKQKSGQIVLISSLAGFKGLGGASAYCSSKAFVRVFGESLYVDLKKYGIKVNIVCPGWIKTPLTDKNQFKMPFIMNADKAAKIIVDNLKKNKIIIKFPLKIYYVIRLLEFLPMKISAYILHRLPSK